MQNKTTPRYYFSSLRLAKIQMLANIPSLSAGAITVISGNCTTCIQLQTYYHLLIQNTSRNLQIYTNTLECLGNDVSIKQGFLARALRKI